MPDQAGREASPCVVCGALTDRPFCAACMAQANRDADAYEAGRQTTRSEGTEMSGSRHPCGCDTREGHVESYDEDEGHGERAPWDAEYGLTGPVKVPNTGTDYGTFIGQDDAYCYCGHPNYMTCHAWLGVSYA